MYVTDAYTLSNAQFWEDYYNSTDPTVFDWYGSWHTDVMWLEGEATESLGTVLARHLDPQASILVLGCGRSDLSELMYREGFENITNADISESLLQGLESRLGPLMPKMSWKWMNASAMSADSASFDIVLEKGTFDSLQENLGLLEAASAETRRVLRRAGLLISITDAPRDRRLDQLGRKRWQDCLTHSGRIPTTTGEKEIFVHVCRKSASAGAWTDLLRTSARNVTELASDPRTRERTADFRPRFATWSTSLICQAWTGVPDFAYGPKSSFWAKESTGYQPLPLAEVPEALAMPQEPKGEMPAEEVAEEDISTKETQECEDRWSVKDFEAKAAAFVSGRVLASSRTIGSRSQWQDALVLLADLQDSRAAASIRAYTAAIRALRSGGRWQHALALMAQMSAASLQPDVILHSAAMSACERGSAWQAALALLKDAVNIQLQVDVILYSAAISTCDKGQQWQQALALFGQLQESQLRTDVIVCNAAISACAKSGQWQKALALLEQLPQQHLVPSEVTYNTAISATAKAGRWEVALQLLADLHAVRIQPGAIAFNSATAACATGGHWLQALALVAAAEKAKVADLIGASSAIAACEKASEWQVALALLWQLEEAGIQCDLLVYNSATSACEKAAEWQWALALLEQAQVKSLRVDLISFNAAISACGNAGCWEQALHLLGALRPRRLCPDSVTSNALTSAYEKASQWQRALGALSPGSNVVALAAAVSACALSREWQQALVLLCELRTRALRSNTILLNSSLTACEKGEQWQLALDLLGTMESSGLPRTRVSFNAAISATEKGKAWLQAFQLLALLQGRSFEADSISYIAAISAAEKGGRWISALQLLTEVEGSDLKVGVVTYNTALAACKKANRLPQALQVVDDLHKQRLQPDIITISTLIGDPLRPLALAYYGRAWAWLLGELGLGEKGSEPVLIRRSTRADTLRKPSTVTAESQVWEYLLESRLTVFLPGCWRRPPTAKTTIAMAGRVASATAFALSAGSCLAFVAPKAEETASAASLRATPAPATSAPVPTSLGAAGAVAALAAGAVGASMRQSRGQSTARRVVGVCTPLTDKFDPLNLGSTDAKMDRYTQVEIKHGRVAMLATVGYIMPEIFRFPGCEEFKHGLGALESIPAEGWFQLFALVGAHEILVKPREGGMGLYDFGLGTWLLDGIDDEELERRQTSERNNGRLAMVAIMGMMWQDGTFGQPPLAYMNVNGFWGEPVNFIVQDIANCKGQPGLCAQSTRGERTAMRAMQKLAEGDYVELETYPEEMEMSPSVPFLRYPQVLKGWVGEEKGFDPLGVTDALPVYWVREAELKHGRIAMLATVGWIATDLGFRFPGDKFQAVKSSVEAHDKMVEAGYMLPFFGAIGVFELFALWLLFQAWPVGDGINREAGDFWLGKNFLPKEPAKEKDMRLKELENGRLAMFAFSGIVTQAVITGKTWPFFD
ncbi:unnamed protein product [Symbiodinium natans]|uniref:Methyltransferase domain-containing protein n=1 Tax=Symbiodinium natans TaxID=878477 RepID=A0A812RXQ5_9DINO|nr:unnamed protein product [Symbiodinium natans]